MIPAFPPSKPSGTWPRGGKVPCQWAPPRVRGAPVLAAPRSCRRAGTSRIGPLSPSAVDVFICVPTPPHKSPIYNRYLHGNFCPPAAPRTSPSPLVSGDDFKSMR